MPLSPDSRRWQIVLGDAEILRLEGVVERLTRCAERLAENADVWREVAIGAFGWAAENQRTIESQRRVIADQREQIRQLLGQEPDRQGIDDYGDMESLDDVRV